MFCPGTVNPSRPHGQPFRPLRALAGAAGTSLALCVACGGGGGGGSTINPPTTRTVQGVAMDTHLALNAATGVITPSSMPHPSSYMGAIQAILADGTVLPGSYNPATGAYAIANVPNGPCWLHAANTYVWTSGSAVSLAVPYGGRANVVLDGSDSNYLFQCTGLTPWLSEDYLVAFDFNTDFYLTRFGFPNGSSSANAALSWVNLPLLQSAQGDAPSIFQVTDNPVGTVHTFTPTKACALSGLAMTDGFSATLAAPFSPVPLTDSVYLNFSRSQFAQYRGQYNPHASVDYGPFMEVDSKPGATVYGTAGQWLDGVQWQDYDPSATTDVNLGPLPSPALAPGFERFYCAGESHYLTFQLPGTTGTTIKAFGIRSYTLTEPDATHPLRPLVSPVKAPTINGLSLFSNQAGVGLAPTIAWTAPDLGTPQGYQVIVNELTASGGTTVSTAFAWFYVGAGQTSMTLPAGILAAGHSYWFRITAFADSTWDPTAAPWASHHFPYGYSQSLSSMVTP